MPSVLVVGNADNIEKWEAGFRTHGALFTGQGVSSPIRYATAAGNRIAAIFEVDDLDAYFAAMDSPETAAAMAEDGFQKESAEMFILDKAYHF